MSHDRAPFKPAFAILLSAALAVVHVTPPRAGADTATLLTQALDGPAAPLSGATADFVLADVLAAGGTNTWGGGLVILQDGTFGAGYAGPLGESVHLDLGNTIENAKGTDNGKFKLTVTFERLNATYDTSWGFSTVNQPANNDMNNSSARAYTRLDSQLRTYPGGGAFPLGGPRTVTMTVDLTPAGGYNGAGNYGTIDWLDHAAGFLTRHALTSGGGFQSIVLAKKRGNVGYYSDLSLEQVSQTVWTGAIDADYDKAGNWTAGLPDFSDDAVITTNATLVTSPDLDVTSAGGSNGTLYVLDGVLYDANAGGSAEYAWATYNIGDGIGSNTSAVLRVDGSFLPALHVNPTFFIAADGLVAADTFLGDAVGGTWAVRGRIDCNVFLGAAAAGGVWTIAGGEVESTGNAFLNAQTFTLSDGAILTLGDSGADTVTFSGGTTITFTDPSSPLLTGSYGGSSSFADFAAVAADAADGALGVFRTSNTSLQASDLGGGRFRITTVKLWHSSTVRISNNTNFKLSVFPEKAAYSGDASGVFGDGTVLGYRFCRNGVAPNIVSYADDGAGIVGEATNQSFTTFAAFELGDVWTVTGPGTLTGGIPDFSTLADSGGATPTISGGYNVRGNIDIAKVSSGTVYILCGGYDNPFTVTLTMSGESRPDAVEATTIDPPSTRNMYVVTFRFADGGPYDTIRYAYTGSASNRSRFMGVILDAKRPPGGTVLIVR